jgi:hypothetical protein
MTMFCGVRRFSVEGDGERQEDAGDDIERQRHQPDRAEREDDAEAKGIARRDASRRDRTILGALHQSVDVAVVPHVDRARRAGRDRDAQDSDEAEERVDVARREIEPGPAGEDDERHHPRLEQREIIPDAADRARRSRTLRRGNTYRPRRRRADEVGGEVGHRAQ